MPPRSTASKAAFVLVTCLLCAACGKEERASGANDVIEAQEAKSGGPWLSATDNTDPALWLARREAGHDGVAGEVAVGRMRAALLAARPHFLETDRMLANRTAQTGKMLAEDGRAEGYADLLEALSNVAAEAGQKQTYGVLCQHYFNLRHKHVTREDALRLLSERYRTQKQFR
ncbi:hypothetical protein [Methylocystis iwaonis]|uniref:hypothetical protein n=1 Tax=Methylocystis iwaonis TaxID=2885079 RepID=UPI002E7B1DEF|nr:hypothetical protein [Methylocystis iwaonis]